MAAEGDVAADALKVAGGEKQWPSQSLSPEAQRRMRFYLSCAIIDLKFDLWDIVQTHFVLEPSRRDLEENLDPAAAGDGDSSGASAGERGRSSSHRSDVKLGDAEEEDDDDEDEEEKCRRFAEKCIDPYFIVLGSASRYDPETTPPPTTYADDSDDDDEEDAIKKAEEESSLEHNELWREFTDKYIIASGYDDRFKEMDAIGEVYFDTTLDEETRTYMIDKLWRHIEKELSDRARAVSTGKFKF
uniref:Uncharacterized protein n=1 Tax=Oryza barthii TaxID=65489 RepID=A0A0D3GXQ1_9ORYZ